MRPLRLRPVSMRRAVLAPRHCKQEPARRLSIPLDGIVLNSVTGGLTVRAALVRINPQMSALTGADGKFHFEGVPQGQMYVSVRKPGYFNEDQFFPGGTRNNPLFRSVREWDRRF